MGVETAKLYKNNSNPLEEVDFDELKENDLFINSKGNRFRCLSDGKFIMDKSSDLVEGEIVEELTPKQLKLYWNIMNFKDNRIR